MPQAKKLKTQSVDQDDEVVMADNTQHSEDQQPRLEGVVETEKSNDGERVMTEKTENSKEKE